MTTHCNQSLLTWCNHQGKFIALSVCIGISRDRQFSSKRQIYLEPDREEMQTLRWEDLAAVLDLENQMLACFYSHSFQCKLAIKYFQGWLLMLAPILCYNEWPYKMQHHKDSGPWSVSSHKVQPAKYYQSYIAFGISVLLDALVSARLSWTSLYMALKISSSPALAETINNQS